MVTHHYRTISQESQRCECPHCGSFDVEQTPAKPPHYARLDCLSCGRWIKWVPNLEKDEILRNRVEGINLSDLVGWSRSFIENLQHLSKMSRLNGTRFKLSDKQLNCLTSIESRQGGLQ